MQKEDFILLNDEKVKPDQVKKHLCNPTLSDWEHQLYSFLNEWFSESTYILAQTSGSTGKPKTIELSKAVMRKSAERTIAYFGLQPNDRLLLSLPCRYIAGKMMVVRAIVGQMNLITVDPTTDFTCLKDEAYDFGALVPNQVVKILEQPSGRKKLQNIKNLLIGGSAISSELEQRISFMDSRIVSTYGMTETASHVAIRELSGPEKSDFYHCLHGISVSLQENDCLQIHLPEYSDPLKTNDLAELKSEKAFKILGRADSVIISGGIKYSPETIEKKLEKLIVQPFVISAVPDEKLGEKIVLVIEGVRWDTTFLQEEMQTILSVYERPRTIYFIEQFPLTSSGKIKRKDLKQIIQNLR